MSNGSTLRRLGYHDFLAFAELVSGGKFQGFVRVRHHLLCGARQAVFRAGSAVKSESSALELAERKIDSLIRLLNDGRLPLDKIQEGRRPAGSHLSTPSASETSAIVQPQS